MCTRILAFATSLILLTGTVLAEDSQPESISFKDFTAGLDARKNTALAAKHFWEKSKMEAVTWTAEVWDVTGGRGRATVYLASEGSPTYKGYNIVLVTFDMETAGTLKKKQMIKFKGRPINYKAKTGHPVIVTLGEGEFLEIKE